MSGQDTPPHKVAPVPLIGGKRHRRPASGLEHARRVAWGRQWGAIMSAHAKTYKRQGG